MEKLTKQIVVGITSTILLVIVALILFLHYSEGAPWRNSLLGGIALLVISLIGWAVGATGRNYQKNFIILLIGTIFFTSCDPPTESEQAYNRWVAQEETGISLIFPKNFEKDRVFEVVNEKNQELLIEIIPTSFYSDKSEIRRIFIKRKHGKIIFPVSSGHIKVYRLNEERDSEYLFKYDVMVFSDKTKIDFYPR